jgi:HK97 family phage prohead protease
MRKETRIISTEVRASKDAGKPIIEGYAAVFNARSQDLGGFIETVKPGAFRRAIENKSDVRALVNHDPSLLLGRTKSGTLKLWEDEKGLKFRCELPDTQYAKDVYTSIERGDMDQCSFSFKAVKQTWGEARTDDGNWIATRDLEDVDVYDVSAVTYPAYEETSLVARTRWSDAVPAEVRSMIEAIESRVYNDKKDIPNYVPEDKAAQWMEVWNSVYKAAIKEGKSKDEAEKLAFAQANGVAGPHADKKSGPEGEKRDGIGNQEDTQMDVCHCDCKKCMNGECEDCKADDCDDPNCDCQNIDMEMPESFQEDEEEIGENALKLAAEQRAENKKKVRTKRVAGKNLTKSAFAYVGDPERTETWKLPIHDASHVRNALARFNQTKGIPADKKAAVYRKIVAAAKKFGIEVSDEDKKRMQDFDTDEQNMLRAAQLEKELAADLDAYYRRHADEVLDDENRRRAAELIV